MHKVVIIGMLCRVDRGPSTTSGLNLSARGVMAASTRTATFR